MKEARGADPTKLTERFGNAMAEALRLHGRQERKGSRVPYLGHLLGTAALVVHFNGDEDQAIAALLHDAAEDQGGRPTLESIRAQFGDRVARIVEGCTDTFEEEKPPWRPRKEAYLEALLHKDEDVLLVSAADKLDNARAIVADLRALGNEVWARFKGGRESLWYYRELAKVFGQRSEALPRWASLRAIAEELDSAVTEMERLASTGSR